MEGGEEVMTPLDPGDVRQQPALHQRAWDLLRQMRSELLDQELISREEYAWLLAEAPGAADGPGQGSPAPRRLESYDEHAARLKNAEGQLKALCKVIADPDGVKKLIAERDEAREFRRDEFDLRTAAEERAEKAEADLAEVARQRDAYRERAKCLRNRLRNSERLRLAPPPAPSGWQLIESAPNPTPDTPHNSIEWKSFLVWVESNACTYCVVRRGGKFDVMGGGLLQHEPTHWMPLPLAPWQTARAEAPSGWQQREREAFAAGMKWVMPWDRQFREESADKGYELFAKRQNAKDAIPPVSEASPTPYPQKPWCPLEQPEHHTSECVYCKEADASPAKEMP